MIDTFQSMLRALLVIADVVHTRHWFKSRSYAEHHLLETLYGRLRHGADQVAEYLAESGDENSIITNRTVELDSFLSQIENKSVLELIEAARNNYYIMRNAKVTDTTFCSLIDELDKELVESCYLFKQEYKNIKASNNKKVKAKRANFIRSAVSFSDVYKVICNILKQLRLDKDASVLSIKQDNLFVITYEGRTPNKASDKIITTLENNLDANWVVYLEDIDNEFAIIHCEKN